MKSIPLLVLLALLAGDASGQGRPQLSPSTTTSRVDAGRQALASRRFLEAVDHLTAATRAQPQGGEAFYLLGVAYWADDRAMSISADRAVEAFARAVAIDPRAQTVWGLRALEQLAVSAVRSERLDRAEQAYRRLLAIEKRPEMLARYQTQIEEIALDRGTYQPQPSTLRGPTGEIIGPIGPLKMRTNQWFEKGRHTQDPVKAEEYYRRAVKTDPVMWQAHLNYGVALARQRKYAESLGPLADAAARWRAGNPSAPPHLRAHLWRLVAFLELNRIADAGQEVAILVKLPDQDSWVRLYVLRYLAAAGRASEAVAGLEAMVADNPEDVETLYAQALAYQALGRRADAVATIKKALTCIPGGHLVFGRWVQPLSQLVQ